MIGYSKIFYLAFHSSFVPYVIKVEKENAEKMRKWLLKKKILSDEWKIVQEEDYIYFPIREKIDGAIWIELPKRERKISPYEKIVNMLNKELNIPNHWEKIGDTVILQEFKDWKEYGYEVGKAFADVLKVKTVVIYHGTYGEFREPRITKIFGESTETIHIENGIKYKLDIAKIMFSSGNVDERIRMGKIDARDETIVDLFAGIGYFTLPLAKYGRAKKIYACEKNPIAYRYLLENIELNELENIIPLFGDNRNISPLKIADRVIMGYIHTEPFLDIGFKALKKEGGIIHYHNTITTEERDWKMENELKFYGERNGFEISIISKRVVKSYAPHIWHVVIDARATPKN